MLVPKFGLIFRKIWNVFRLIHLENNIKKSCCLARIPVDLRFICLSHCVDAILFPPRIYLYSCSPQPLYIGMLFPHCFVVVFFACLTWCWLHPFFVIFFSTCKMPSIKNWFVLATVLTENLTIWSLANPLWFNMLEHDL